MAGEDRDIRRRETGRLFHTIGAALRKERLVALNLDVQAWMRSVRQADERVLRGGIVEDISKVNRSGSLKRSNSGRIAL